MTRRLTAAILLLACAAPAASAQDEAAPDQTLEERVAQLEQELDALQADDAEDELSGWQVQLRAGVFHLAHNRRSDILAGGSNSQYGWNMGVALVAPLWPGLGPIDLAATVQIDYRQVRYSPDYRSPLTGASGSISYVNVAALPTIRLPLADGMFTPFVCLGPTMQVASPPKDGVTYLDLGFTLGAGFDLRLHPRISLGLDYKFTWFGVGDQEDEDFGLLASYLGFNF
jgi:opacity protein-like surface antigen